MPNQFINLPANAANGPGAAVDVSALGALKTIVIAGAWPSGQAPTIAIEINNDAAAQGTWTALASSQVGAIKVVSAAAKWMRVNVSGYLQGPAPRVDVGATSDGCQFAALPTTPGNGTGAAVDVSALGSYKTFTVGSAFNGVVLIDVSEDGVNNWAQAMAFNGPGQQSIILAAHYMRVRRTGVPVIAPGAPIVNVGGANDPGGGGGSISTDDTLVGDGDATPLGVRAPNQVDLTNDEVDDVPPGTPVYVDAPDGFKRAQADAPATGRVFGLAVATVNSGDSGIVQTGGVLELTTDEWDAICGTEGGLAFNVPYYLDAAVAGMLTATPPSLTGEVVQQVIVGISPTKAKIGITVPEVIGAGSNIIRLRNANAGALIIGTPVYSAAAGGMDKGIANGSGKSRIVGLIADVSVDPGQMGNVCVEGLFVATTDQWDQICGTSGGLAFNTPYYLDPVTPGKLTPVAPAAAGQEVVQVITALSPTEARIAILAPILL